MEKLILALGILYSTASAGAIEPTNEYSMPSEPMTSEQMIAVTDRLVSFVPEGYSSYLGIDSNGKSCQVGVSLSRIGQAGSFSLYPGANLGFSYGGSSAPGDAVLLYLIDQSIETSADNTIATLNLAIVNRAGFGPDRLVVYRISSQNGQPIDYQSSLIIPPGNQFLEGQPIAKNLVAPKVCNRLVLKNN